MSRLPLRFHIGTQRAGSTFFYHLIKQHPRVGVSPRQEVNFYHKHFSNGESWYRNQFPPEKRAIDTSPKYFQKGALVAPRIRRRVPEGQARFLLILRNPIDYVPSHFTMHKRNGYFDAHPEKYPETEKSLPEHLDRYPFYRERALYAKNLEENWFKNFEPRQFKVVLFEEFVDNPQRKMTSIQHFFGLSPHRLETVESSKNKSLRFRWLYKLRNWVVRWEPLKRRLKHSPLFNWIYDRFLTGEPPRLSAGERQRVGAHFHRDVHKLKTLLDRPLSPWTDFAPD